MSASGARRLRKETAGGSGTSVRKIHTPSPAMVPSAATNAIVQRQSPRPPMTAPVGDPSAVDRVRPATTTESANPRRSVGASIAADPVAVGENIAAPRPANARLNNARPKAGAVAPAKLPSTKIAAPARRRLLRGTEAAIAAMFGDSNAKTTE